MFVNIFFFNRPSSQPAQRFFFAAQRYSTEKLNQYNLRLSKVAYICKEEMRWTQNVFLNAWVSGTNWDI